MKPQFRNIVLSGGAFKASAFIGCYKYLEEHGGTESVRNVIGSSAGSIIGFLICLGYTWKQMRDFVVVEAKAFSEQEIDIESIFNIFYTLGIDDGAEAIRVFERALQTKYPNHDVHMTFLTLAKITGKNFVVCGSNITTASATYFGVDTTPHMEVTKALRISVSIPMIMTPVIEGNDLYVDASLFNNFPIEYFHDKNLPFTDTLALIISTPSSPIALDNLNMLAYMKLMLESIFKRVNQKKEKLMSSPTNVIVDIVLEDDMFDFEKFKLIMDSNSLDKFIDHGYSQLHNILVVQEHEHEHATVINQDAAVEDETNA
jgi:predicted acylesterase/phospholipase RssA